MRHPASKALESACFAEEVARRDSAVTALRNVLEDVAAGRYLLPATAVVGLAVARDDALDRYAATGGGTEVVRRGR